ncbi:MAG TPA: DUF1269 domain-containing protein [Chloroflexota bacterium]|jgi:uncharacterized membrane protein|nr:DUF1269 domain-containing protein [Chloroflexota bacterium]
MATLTVWKFDSAEGAEQAVNDLQRMQRQELIQIVDAAIVTWPQGAKKPKTHQLNNLAGAGALGGAFWGLLFGLLFFVPFLGLAIGAGMGALTGALSDVGIDDNMIKEMRTKITPGTSALFLMTQAAVLDKIRQETGGKYQGHAELIQSNLSSEQEAKLREVFGEEGVATGASQSAPSA